MSSNTQKLTRARLLRLASVLVIAFICLSPLAKIATAQGAAAAPGIDLQAIDRYLTAQVAANHLPGLAVAVVQGQQVLYLRGFGDARAGQPVTPQTQFYLGSLSKSFTALAVMQLVEQGKVELDAPVWRYLPWFQVADSGETTFPRETSFPDASAQITIRQLLNQTSGLSESGDPGSSEYAPSLEGQVRAMRDARPNAAPGSRYQYYNQNYAVLGLVIEQASGQPYGEYMSEHVFAPLDMTGTTAAGPASAPQLAQGHGQMFSFPIPRAQEYQPGSVSSGYIIASAGDLAHYMIALLNQGSYAGQALVQPASLALTQTPPEGIGSLYGMGWAVLDDPEFGRVIYHDGAVLNYHAEIILLPERGLGIAALINQGGLLRQMTANPAVTSGLADLLAGKQPQPSAYAWPGLALLGLAAADLLNHLRQFWLLPRWKASLALCSTRGRSMRRNLSLLADILIPLVMVFGLPPLLNLLLDGSADGLTFWKQFYGLLPDAAAWLLAGACLSLVRGGVKVGVLVGQVK